MNQHTISITQPPDYLIFRLRQATIATIETSRTAIDVPQTAIEARQTPIDVPQRAIVLRQTAIIVSQAAIIASQETIEASLTAIVAYLVRYWKLARLTLPWPM